jgi:hypothetical protein
MQGWYLGRAIFHIIYFRGVLSCKRISPTLEIAVCVCVCVCVCVSSFGGKTYNVTNYSAI